MLARALLVFALALGGALAATAGAADAPSFERSARRPREPRRGVKETGGRLRQKRQQNISICRFLSERRDSNPRPRRDPAAPTFGGNGPFLLLFTWQVVADARPRRRPPTATWPSGRRPPIDRPSRRRRPGSRLKSPRRVFVPPMSPARITATSPQRWPEARAPGAGSGVPRPRRRASRSARAPSS
jgi:hypothetical protein